MLPSGRLCGGNDPGSPNKKTEVASDPKARNASLECGGGEDVLEVRITHDVRNSFRPCDHNRHAPKRMHRPQVARHRLGARNRQRQKNASERPDRPVGVWGDQAGWQSKADQITELGYRETEAIEGIPN